MMLFTVWVNAGLCLLSLKLHITMGHPGARGGFERKFGERVRVELSLWPLGRKVYGLCSPLSAAGKSKWLNLQP